MKVSALMEQGMGRMIMKTYIVALVIHYFHYSQRWKLLSSIVYMEMCIAF